PWCSPDLEPRTETSRTFVELAPRKLIWVSGLAVSVSGAGETSMAVPGRLALGGSVAGRQAGEIRLACRVVPEPKTPRLGEPSTIAATAHASTTTSRTMYRFRMWLRTGARRARQYR